LRTVVVAAFLWALFLVPGHSADPEEARKAAHSFKEVYWNCLANETQRIFPKKLSGQDFALFIKGACPSEAQRFREVLIDFLALKYPEVQQSLHFASAEQAISAARDDIVKAYIELINQ
jgi:hypothetical protein